MGLKTFIGKIVAKKLVGGQMDKILNFASGYKTYITALVGILIAFVGWAFGPIEFGSVVVPDMSFKEFFEIFWAALLVIFLRKGIKSDGKKS